MNRRGLLGSLLSASAIRDATAQGQAEARWPSREMSLVTGFGPGGGTDLVARAVAAHMEKTFGVSVVVRNTPGAAAPSARAASPSPGRTATPSAWSGFPRWWSRR
jgi:tripartite-type tricarboxylate transporter receptor subunit TctC